MKHSPKAYYSGRSVVMTPNGMVATNHPLAAKTGISILERGGHAVDAAIAANAVMSVVDPSNCGIGGDLFALIWDNKTKKIHGLNASGKAPAQANIDAYLERRLKEIPIVGPYAWTVPGCVGGWEALISRFARLSLAELLEPAIHYASAGFPVTENISQIWKQYEKDLSPFSDSQKTYLPHGKSPKKGEVFKNPFLSKTYQKIAREGPECFYKGEIAKKIIEFSRENKGFFSLEDFATNQPIWVDPVKTNYRGYDIWELPPNGQGIGVLQMLNILEGFDLKKMGPYSAEFWHLYVEAKKLVYADRAKYYADLDLSSVPLQELISKSYAETRRKNISLDTCTQQIEAGEFFSPQLAHTNAFSVVDKERNCVSLLQSNAHHFGSKMVPYDLGFVLQDRGHFFSLDKNHLNALKGGKRPFHTIIPAIATLNHSPIFVLGFTGGDMQVQGHVLSLINLIDFEMDAQQAADAPRIEHKGSATPRGQKEEAGGGLLEAEIGIPLSVMLSLEKKGHQVKPVIFNEGGYQGVWIDPQTGMLHGGSDYRKDGCAIGY